MAETVKFDETTQDQPNSTSGNVSINVLEVDKYQFIEEAFKGTGGFKSGKYLVPHHREMFYDKRMQLAHYANYTGPVITAMYKAVFSEQIQRDYGSNAVYDLFVDDCTHYGIDLTNFVKLLVKYIRMHGMVLLIVDNKNQEGVELKTEVVDKKTYPYCYMKKAYELNADGTNFDDNGRMIDVMYFDHQVIEKDAVIKYYRQWTATESILYREKEYSSEAKTFQDKYELVESQPHDFGELPCYIFYEEPLDNPKTLFADTPRFQLAKINYTIFNQDSEGREVERNQGFGILTVPEDGSQEEQDKTIGTNNYLAYPHDSQRSPEMINVEPALIKELADKRQRNMEALISIAEQSGVQGINKSKDAKSGLAYAFEFFAYESTLKESSRLATEVEKKIREFFNKWTSENVEYDVKYPTNFKPNQTQEKYTQLIEVTENPSFTQQTKDKCEIEIYQILFPDDEEGLELVKKQQETRVSELESDIDTDDDDNESES